jgi:signal transduction histidine kinase
MRISRIFATCLPVLICFAMYGFGLYLKMSEDRFAGNTVIKVVSCVDVYNVQVSNDLGLAFRCYEIKMQNGNDGVFIENTYGPLGVDVVYGDTTVSEKFSALSTFEGRFVHIAAPDDLSVVRVSYYNLINFSREPRLLALSKSDVDYFRYLNFFSGFFLPLASCLFLYFVATFFFRVSFFDTEFSSYRYAALGAFSFSSLYFLTLFPGFSVSYPWMWQGLIYLFSSAATWSFFRFVIIYSEVEISDKIYAGIVAFLFLWIPFYCYFGYSWVFWVDAVWINFNILLLLGSVFFIFSKRGFGFSIVPLGLLFCLCLVILDWAFVMSIDSDASYALPSMYWGPMGLMILFYVVFFDFFFKLNSAYKKNRNSHKVMMAALREQRDELHAIYSARSEDEHLKNAWEEREILARDLHDIIGSKLSLVMLLILKGGVPKSLIIQQVKLCLVDMRSLIVGGSVKNGELLYAKFVSDYRDTFHAMGVGFSALVVESALNAVRAVDLAEALKILRELITNAVKYEALSSLAVSISKVDDAIDFKLDFVVKVGDSVVSKWFADVSGGMGDELIRYRLKLIAGQFSTYRKENRLVFIVSVPVSL